MKQRDFEKISISNGNFQGLKVGFVCPHRLSYEATEKILVLLHKVNALASDKSNFITDEEASELDASGKIPTIDADDFDD